MAPATTPTVKILTDLGYQVWEMESDADMLRALVEAINTLSITNPNDGRIYEWDEENKDWKDMAPGTATPVGMIP